MAAVFDTDSKEWDPRLVLTTVVGVDSRKDPTLMTLVLTTALEVDRSRGDPTPVAMVLATIVKSPMTVLKSQSWTRSPTLIPAASTKYPETDQSPNHPRLTPAVLTSAASLRIPVSDKPALISMTEVDSHESQYAAYLRTSLKTAAHADSGAWYSDSAQLRPRSNALASQVNHG